MSSEVMNQSRKSIEDEVSSRPSAFEFEMAYQARTAIDRIKFAIKHTEQFGARTEQMFEASLQLLDAVERLEILDRRFQERSRLGSRSLQGNNILDFTATRYYICEWRDRPVAIGRTRSFGREASEYLAASEGLRLQEIYPCHPLCGQQRG